MAETNTGDLGVDLDGTLAEQQVPFNPYSVGPPILSMLHKVRAEIAKGRHVVCFTARAGSNDPGMWRVVRAWLDEQGLQGMRITNVKGPGISEYWDDRARQVLNGEVVQAKEASASPSVEPNEGRVESGMAAPTIPVKQIADPGGTVTGMAPTSFMRTLAQRQSLPKPQSPTIPQTPGPSATSPTAGKVPAPSYNSVTPAWYKMQTYGPEQFDKELNTANQYRSDNPDLFKYEGMPHWFRPVPIDHYVPDAFGGQAARSPTTGSKVELNHIDVSDMEPENQAKARSLSKTMGSAGILRHEAFHAALEPDAQYEPMGGYAAKLKGAVNPAWVPELQPTAQTYANSMADNTRFEASPNHDVAPAEMRNYMSTLQEHQFQNSGSRFTTPDQYRQFLHTIPFHAPDAEFNKSIEALPADPQRMFRQLRNVHQTDPATFNNILDWQAKTIPGYAGVEHNGDSAKQASTQPMAYGYPLKTAAEMGLDTYLKANPHVAGMAWGGGENGSDKDEPRVIVVNPHNQYMSDPIKAEGLTKIEAARHKMSENAYVPGFAITPEQQTWRKQLGAYATDDNAFKQSIVSRLLVHDTVPGVSPEQETEAAAFAGKHFPASPSVEPNEGRVDDSSGWDDDAIAKKEAASKDFHQAVNEATASGKVPHDIPFYVNDDTCIVNAGDWHDADQIAASMELVRDHFDKVIEENECACPEGYTKVKPSAEAKAQGKKSAATIPTTGPHAIMHALKGLDLDVLEKQARAMISSGKVTKRDQGVKMLGIIDGMKRNELQPTDLMISRVPVLPPAFRPYGMMGNTYLPGVANELYGDLFKHIGLHKETLNTLGTAGAVSTRRNMFDAVKALYGYGDPVSPKLQQRGNVGYMKQITGPGSPKFCYDDKTEILTRDKGWVLFGALPPTSEVATINPTTMAFEWQQPTDYYAGHHEGAMVEFEVGKCTGKRMSLLVTPEHRMWFKTRHGHKVRMTEDNLADGWAISEATTPMRNRQWIMTAAPEWKGVTTLPDCVRHWDPAVFAEFIGWWLAEGSVHTDGTILHIWQTSANDPYCADLHALFERIRACGVRTSFLDTWCEKKNHYKRAWSVLGIRPLVDWLCANAGRLCGVKRIPRLFMDWDKPHLELLWTAYHKGDGAKRAPYTMKVNKSDKHRFRSTLTTAHDSFVTTSHGLFDDLMELGFKLGVTVRRLKEFPHLRPAHHAEAFNASCIGRWFCATDSATQSRKQYAGMVYCCAVPNTLLVVRRNGAAVVSGNSFAQRRMFSKTQDNVARGAITVAPHLNMNQIGVPKEMAWDMMGSIVQGRLARNGMTPMQAMDAVRTRSREADIALHQEVKERPFIYSRAPAWHQFNTVAGYGQLIDGDNIAISPYVSSGLNADFDGDEVLNQVLACIPSESLPLWRMSYHNIDSHEIRFPQGSSIPAMQDGKLFLFDLEDFPHGDLQRSKEGAKGRIDFHTVPHPIQVLSYDEATGLLKWADVAFWSKHYQREIEIVDTHNGYQLITDDDPRAVYGTASGSLAMSRFTPTTALDAKVLIPRARRMPAALESVLEVPGEVEGTTLHWKTARLKSSIPLNATTGWFMGAMCGDGWVIKTHGVCSGFCLADNDGFNIAKLRSATAHFMASGQVVNSNSVVMASFAPGRYGDTTSYRFGSSELGEWLRPIIGGERDETTSGSGNKHLPPFYLSAPEEFRSALLCGLIDTDGSISVSNGKAKPQLMASMGSTSIRMCIETKLLAASLGISSRITPSQTPLGKACWMLSFSNGDIQRWGAPYMCHEVKLKALASVPKIEDSAVTAKYDIVPISQACATALAQFIGCPKINAQQRKTADPAWLAPRMQRQNLYMPLAAARNVTNDKYGTLSRQTADAIVAFLGSVVVAEMPDGAAWLKVVEATDVTWERVIAIQKTGIKEDGYDLTVPGYETFMSADGVILSNTINLHVPVLADSVQEAKDKLMPDKMLFSIKDPDQVMAQPKHEQILGLFESQRAPAKQVHTFGTKQEALAAIRKGAVSYSDEIDIPDQAPSLPPG